MMLMLPITEDKFEKAHYLYAFRYDDFRMEWLYESK